MKKLLEFAAVAAGVMVGLVVLVFVVLKLISDDQYKQWISSAVQSATGRDFSIDTLETDLNTSISVVAKNVRMANADWGSKPDMLNIGKLEAEVSLLSLLSGVADLRVVVSQTDVLAESNSEGTSNWDMGTSEPSAEESVSEPEAKAP